jgi:hypothetical protein
MQCPRCRLFNPAYAMRCDCGYNFQARAVDRTFDQVPTLPTAIKVFLVWDAVMMIAFLARLLTTDFDLMTPGIIAWCIADPVLCLLLLRRKNWARYALAIVTFPLGAVLLLRREVKSYCYEPNHD